MAERLHVYNPADEDQPLGFTVNAIEFPLAPNAVTVLESPWPHIETAALLERCLERLGKYGVCQVSGDPKKDKPAIEAAEEAHAAYLRVELGRVLDAHQGEVDKAKRLGMVAPAETEVVTSARRKAKEWGLLAALVLGLVSPAAAQTVTRTVAAKFDYDSATPTYCALDGADIAGVGRLTTSGSNQTVTAVSGSPFDGVNVGAQIIAKTSLATFTRTIIAKASNVSVTVDSVVDLSATASFTYKNITCGTGAEAGWVDVATLTPYRTWVLSVDQISLASGSLAAILWCRAAIPQAQPVQVYPETGAAGAACVTGLFTATASCAIVDNFIHLSQCRWGITLTDDGGDTGANQEQVTIAAMGARQ